ncbi:hypothetical protein [Streptomyces sp. NPDC002215]|uniref:hypothetical protein n=1 Tax=Streptomyces sp. NPDC002215 TaxID=3154412 RepID=UPI00332186A0
MIWVTGHVNDKRETLLRPVPSATPTRTRFDGPGPSATPAEALDAYRKAHRLLAAELSIKPSAPLRDPQLRMLRSTPGLGLPEPRSRPPEGTLTMVQIVTA